MTTLSEYLEFKAQRMAALREKLSAPDAAPSPLRVAARVAGGSGVRPVNIREFTIVTDSAQRWRGTIWDPRRRNYCWRRWRVAWRTLI